MKSLLSLCTYVVILFFKTSKGHHAVLSKYPARYFILTSRSTILRRIKFVVCFFYTCCQWHSLAPVFVGSLSLSALLEKQCNYISYLCCLCNVSSPPTQLKDLQGHGEPRLLGPHHRPVAGAKVLTGRQQQQHGQLVSKLQQLPGVHTILIRLSQTQKYVQML